MEGDKNIENGLNPSTGPWIKTKGFLSKITSWARSDKVWPLALSKIETIIIWLIIFIVDEIIISGGRHSQNYFLFTLNIIAILLLFGYASIRRTTPKFADALKRAEVAVLVYAVLDFLIINLLLEKNNLFIYKSWQTYVGYGAVALTILAISRFKKTRITSPPQEIPLDKP